MENSNILKKAKNIVISSSENWLLKNEDDDIVTILYHKEGEKASCSTACCLGCLFWPVGIVYAILGGSNSIRKQINLHLNEGNITITGDSKFIITIFNLLEKSEISEYIKENKELENARKSQLIGNIIIGVVILFLFIVFITSK